MTAHTANENFAKTVRSERKITAQILKMILDFEDNKYHIELGYSSLFDWLTKGHGYDEGSANRRIQAARAMRAVPEVEQKLQDGKTTMTNLVRAQSIFRHAGQMSKEEKREVIESIEGQTTAEATRTLFQMFPEAASKINQDRRMIVDEEHVRYAFNLSQEQEEVVTRAKELLSHKIPNGSMAEIMTYLAAHFVERNDPLFVNPSRQTQSKSAQLSAAESKGMRSDAARLGTAQFNLTQSNSTQSKATQPKATQSRLTQAGQEHLKLEQAETERSKSEQSKHTHSNSILPQSTAVASKRRVTVRERKQVIRDAGGCCEYVDSVTGKRCDSRVRAEVDHIHMRVHGGSNNRENLRCLCRVHNQYMSEKNLGRAWANRWRGCR